LDDKDEVWCGQSIEWMNRRCWFIVADGALQMRPYN
jgi:hypothetical protein